MSIGKCSQCGHADLDPGFISDAKAQTPGFAVWVEGEMETGIFGGPKLMGRPKWEIEAHRCPRCGHLELFANREY